MGALKRFFKIDKEVDINFNPGEFEILRTKAERAWWESGLLLVTNHRFFWFSWNKSSQQPVIEIDLRGVLGCIETKSWYYLLARPALKILLTNGRSLEFHGIEDFGGVKMNVERLMGQERYTPGALFK
ncbi:MAG: hypothetical protein JNN15_00920 [Blastocatellia bacterium]|nr:hypothetical protein [Blastocatellia bacterium]